MYVNHQRKLYSPALVNHELRLFAANRPLLTGSVELVTKYTRDTSLAQESSSDRGQKQTDSSGGCTLSRDFCGVALKVEDARNQPIITQLK